MMSKMKNRKTAVRAAENELPEPGENECIVRVLGMRSGNMVEVFNAGGDASASYLCRVPSKFNKMIWIKRGANYFDGFLIVGLDALAVDDASRVRAEVLHVLQKDQIKHLKKRGLWCDAFEASAGGASAATTAAVDGGGDDDLLMRGNRNHRRAMPESDDDEEEDEVDEDEVADDDEVANEHGTD